MRSLGILIVILHTALSVGHAQSFAPVSDPAAIQKKIADVSHTTNSIKSDFVQEKNLSMISEKVVSKGLFYFKKNNKVRLEYTKPFKYLMVINNGKILFKDDEKSTQMDMHKSKMFQEVNNIIINCVQGTVFSGNEFHVTISESATQVLLDMQPASKNLKEFFKNILVLLDKRDYTALKITMNEVSGDNTIINFTNKEINGSIDDGLFAVSK